MGVAIVIVPIKWITIAGATVIAPNIDGISGADEASYIAHTQTHMAVRAMGASADFTGITTYDSEVEATAALAAMPQG